MQVTAQSLYAIYALFYIGRLGYPIKASTISHSTDIPKRFLEITLSKLKSSGILDSKKGPNGGFYLKRPPSEITLLEILSSVESNLNLFECEKYLKNNCVFKELFSSINEKHKQLLNSITLEDILKSQSPGSLDFVI
ncbi:MAG: Rrf2 family transcriptional regulator [Calditerrivibrio sp.]|nr:Rrf2 family transcriptional regulator [Calditerrivibrio sp.]